MPSANDIIQFVSTEEGIIFGKVVSVDAEAETCLVTPKSITSQTNITVPFAQIIINYTEQFTFAVAGLVREAMTYLQSHSWGDFVKMVNSQYPGANATGLSTIKTGVEDLLALLTTNVADTGELVPPPFGGVNLTA